MTYHVETEACRVSVPSLAEATRIVRALFVGTKTRRVAVVPESGPVVYIYEREASKPAQGE